MPSDGLPGSGIEKHRAEIVERIKILLPDLLKEGGKATWYDLEDLYSFMSDFNRKLELKNQQKDTHTKI
mgnify:CR=1 FL=1